MNVPNDILRRKAEAAREDREARVMSPRRALRRALCRAAELGLSLPLSVTGVEEASPDRDQLLAQIDEGGLLVLLDQADGPPGLIILDLQLLAALIEVQTLGQVFAKPAAARPVTRTDAAVAMPLIDGTLSGFAQLLADSAEGGPLSGFHFGHWVKDLRTLAAQLPDGEYRLFRLSTGIGSGDRAGQMLLALPCLPPPEPAKPDPARPQNGGLRDEVLDAPARLDTILHRLEMSLDEVSALKPGDVLTLPLRALGEVRLHTGDRQIVASGVLGQLGGNRAVRLTGFGLPRLASAPAMVEPVAKLAQVDLADPGLIEQARPRKTPAAPKSAPVPAPIAAPAVKRPAAEAAPQAPAPHSPREDPTGTEALLSELGLADLDGGLPSLPALGPLDGPDPGSGSFMEDMPRPGQPQVDG